MREHTLSLRALGGDRVSEAYLAAALYRRAKSLADDPSVPLFFSRIDLETDEHSHIGRRHVMDAAGDPVVVDWRADVSGAFYRATRMDRHGVTRRRRFGFAGGEMTSYEDEHLSDTTERDVRSRILTEEIERPRVGPMRDIVATIQPEQYDVVSADLDQTICVQEPLAPARPRSDCTAPRTCCTPTGRGLLEAACWSSGQTAHSCTTSARCSLPWARSRCGRSPSPSWSRCARALGRSVTRGRSQGRSPDGRGDPTRRLAARARTDGRACCPAWATVARSGARGRRGDRGTPATPRPLLRRARCCPNDWPTWSCFAWRRVRGTDDRVQDAVARTRPVRQLVDSVWPALDPVRLVMRLLGEPEYLADVVGDLLTDDERRSIRWTRPARGPQRAVDSRRRSAR